jgi:hypothetical protein
MFYPFRMCSCRAVLAEYQAIRQRETTRPGVAIVDASADEITRQYWFGRLGKPPSESRTGDFFYPGLDNVRSLIII